MNAPADPAALCTQAKRQIRQRQFAQAAALFQQVLDGDPDHAEAHEGLATVSFLQGDYDTAVEHFSAVIRLRPREAKTYVNLGAVHNRQGEFKKALDVLRKALAKDKKSAEAYYNVGIAYKGMDQLSMAVSAYRESIRLNPQLADAHQNLANVYVEMKNTQQAIAHYQKALEIKPTFERARQGLLKAEQSEADQKKDFHPFGRLVDESKYATREEQEAAGPQREMTRPERNRDRQKVFSVSHDIKDAAAELLKHCKDKLQPSLLALNRAVAEGQAKPGAFAKSHEAFHAALQQSEELREALLAKIKDLREHEEWVRSLK